MSATFLSLQSDLQFSYRDADTSNLSIPLARYKSAINRAVRRINALTLFNEANGSLTPNGTSYAFTLSGSGATELATDYLAARTFYRLNSPDIDGPVDISEIRKLLAAGRVDEGDPTKYALFAGQVVFDKIPPASPIIYSDYCAIPLDMVNDTDVPCPIVGALTTSASSLYQFDGLIVVAAKIELADDLGSTAYKELQKPIFKERLAEFVSLIESGGKHQTLGNSISRSRL